MRQTSLTVLSIFSIIALAGCFRPEPKASLRGGALAVARRTDVGEAPELRMEGLDNVFRLSRNLLSGSEPESEEAFESLRELDVRTVLSVDGATPDVEMAARFGLRYVHIPLRYSTITSRQIAQLVKTFRELESPFYVHCFHGHHRGPTAAAIGRLVLDGVERRRALGEMYHWSRTSEKYAGLYEVVAQEEIPDAETTRAMEWDFPSVRRFRGFRAAMVDVARRFDRLEKLRAQSWTPPSAHPDLDAKNEIAKLLAALEACQIDVEEAMSTPLLESIEATKELSRSLDTRAEGWRRSANDSLEEVARTCRSCHADFRDEFREPRHGN